MISFEFHCTNEGIESVLTSGARCALEFDRITMMVGGGRVELFKGGVLMATVDVAGGGLNLHAGMHLDLQLAGALYVKQALV